MDREFGLMPPEETSEEGPLFISLAPSLSSDRYMPALARVLTGEISSTWEVTPTVSRDMKFKLTVRDNAISGGSTASENMVVTTDDTSGPFVVTSQSEPDNWSLGSIQNITWNVANTDQAPVNCSAIDILLSVDGRNTFSIILAKGVANDGNAEITVPDDVVTTTEARVMVAGAGHIFYQVNASNFSIDNNPLGNEDFNNSLTDFRVWPNPTNGIVIISFPSVSKNTMIEAYDIRGRLVNSLKFKNLATVLIKQ